MDDDTRLRSFIRLAQADHVLASERIGSCAIHTCQPVGASEPDRDFASVYDLGIAYLEPLGYFVARSDRCRRTSDNPRANGHVVSVSRQCAFTARTVPLCVLLQCVGSFRSTRRGGSSTLVYP